MNPGSVEIIDRLSSGEAIKHRNEDDLRFLNRLIVERLKLISQARSTTLMASFTAGDRVGFTTRDGREVQGVVLRLSQKTVSIATDEGERWKVSPGLLHLVQSAGKPLRPDSSIFFPNDRPVLQAGLADAEARTLLQHEDHFT